MRSAHRHELGRILIVACACVHAVLASSLAQGPGLILTPADEPDAHRPLSLADLEQMALANNPTLKQALAQVERARGLCIQAGLYPNPTVGYMAGEIGNEGRSGQQGGFVAQEFVTAGKLRLDQAVAQHRLEQAEGRFETQRLRVLGAVRTQHYDVLAAQRAVEIAEELLTIADRAAGIARDLFEAGEGTRTDVLLAEIEANKAQIVLTNTRNRSSASWRQLRSVVAVASLAPTQLEGSLDKAAPDFKWESTWQQLREQSPEIRTAHLGVPRAIDSLRRAEAEQVPNFRLQAMVQHDAATRDTITTVQFGLPLPIFNRNQGNIRAAHADVHRAQQEVQRLELELMSRLARAFQRYETAVQQVATYNEQILPKARESLDLTTEGYRQQEFDFLQVLTAQRTYFLARLDYLESLAELQKSVVAIEAMLLTDGLSPATER